MSEKNWSSFQKYINKNIKIALNNLKQKRQKNQNKSQRTENIIN